MQKLKKEHEYYSENSIEDEFLQLKRTIIKTAIEHRQNALDTSVKSHAGYLLRKHNYGKIMADYNRELKKIDYLGSVN
ncbi:hypothetical protein [Virgibacillus sp. LDC-1]|uniref:hypothetical protein n=1 Tax=Virgibacillus sp. LDC-1 TaxID=3039856 RepID=UPI0024DE3D85|nr:hypothetical protein [Virgibacillus sp. LDC-1]